jgi:cytochrome c oxidase cbb3-type subunit III
MVMTEFWHWWVIILTVTSLVLCFWIITVNLKNYTHVGEGESMGHEFDGIEELNNPLPKWWTYMFYFILVWSIGYLILFPGLGNYEGVLGWKSSNQGIVTMAESKALAQKAKDEGLLVELNQEELVAEKLYGPIFKAMAETPILELAYDDNAFKVGQRLFLQNCALCHGSDARGSKGFPNLTDSDWLYGSQPDLIKASIMHGRVGAMPGWEASLGEQGVQEMTEYVLKLAGRKVNDKLAKAGKAKFMMCAACHGPDGRGSVAHGLAFGAPNLTDNVWLYGGSRRAVEESVRNGRNGVMPAWKDILGPDKVHVISAYIYRKSHPNQ